MNERKACPTDEQLAALASGELEGNERHQVIAHIDGCGNCYALLADILRVMEELEPEPQEIPEETPSAPVLPFYRRPAVLGLASFAAAALLLLVFHPHLFPGPSRKELQNPAWWRHSFAPTQNPMKERAQEVFSRLIAAADQQQQPQLIILDMDHLFAMAIDAGHILLSDQSLTFCYQGVAPDSGDRRLALVLGHELAHLERNQYQHAFAAYNLLPVSDQQTAPESELGADRLGMLYATLAGFGPKGLLQEDASFFHQWSAQRSLLMPATHPNPDQRAAALMDQLRQIAEEVARFQRGVALYDAGDHSAARAIFLAMDSSFPARETANNIGLTYFREALQLLALCDGSAASRFIWPVTLDRETLASLALFRGQNEGTCMDRPDFVATSAQALAWFQKARARDALHAAPEINYIATLLLRGEAATAMVAAQNSRIQHPQLAHLSLLARYLYALKTETPTDEAISAMQRLWQEMPDSPEIAFNLSEILWETRRRDEAREVGTHFLKLQPQGPHAQLIRARQHQ